MIRKYQSQRPDRARLLGRAKHSAAFARVALVIAVAGGLALAGASRNQQQSSANPSRPASKQAATTNTPSVLASTEEDYRIGAGDVIEIQIEDMPEISRSFRVTTAGTFLMPILGRVKAVNKMPEELAEEIADRLRGDYLKEPKVTIVVKEYNSRSFFIQGAVRAGGVFQIEGRPSLLTLITLAGGPADNHGSQAFIIRRVKDQKAQGAAPQPGHILQVQESQPQATEPQATSDVEEDGTQYQLIKVNINGLFRGNFNNNPLLEPGDIVNIPLLDVFYVAGEVNAPGPFPLKEGTTLRQAVALAQGTKFNAAKDKTTVFRTDQDGKQQELKFDLGAIMSGKKDDVVLMANDIIIVPNSRAKSFGGALLRALGLTTVTRVPVP